MDNSEQLKKDLDAMLRGAESLVKNTEAMARKTFENISPEQAQLFAEQLKKADIGGKLNDIKKQTEDLRKQFNTNAG